MKVIEVRDLKKYYGKVKAVDGISFHVEEGEFFGFLGPNGAGKSTTIRVLTTLAKPTSGEVRVAGFDVVKEDEEVRKRIGLVSDRLILYDRLTVMENLRFFSKLYGLDEGTIKKRARELLELLDMWEWKDTPVSKLSTGMKQKVNLVRALIPDPRILFLDEPTLGLDPHTTRKIRDFIKELNRKGTTIILTTHMLHEAEILCDRVAIINHGKIVAIDTPRNLKHLFREKEIVELELLNPMDISNFDGIVKVLENTGDYYKVEVSDINTFLSMLSSRNVKLKSIRTHEPSLEEIFVKLTEVGS